jgi:hypothetical protein
MAWREVLEVVSAFRQPWIGSRHRLPGRPFAATPRGTLICLLHETATYSAERLEGMAGRRRGGRRGRGDRG